MPSVTKNVKLLNSKLSLPDCEKGLGAVINLPESPDLIDGVRIEPYTLWPDDRGYFLEVARLGQGMVAGYPANTQVSAALGYPGIIKAFHYHVHQTDCWIPALGMLQVGLADLRKDSRTYGARNTIYIGVIRPWRVLIPPGVAHGYKVLGTAPAMLVYLTDHFYDPADEGRLSYNDPRINYDWEIQYK
jgi:dTDP-4-dehydrorhamnose 3,5-epimerase